MDCPAMEDGELEDGEICDDETEESAPPWRAEGGRPGRGAPSRSHRVRMHPRGVGPPPGPPPLPPDFLLLRPFNIAPHGPFPPGHRQQCGPSGPDRPPAAPPPGPPPGLGEPSPRSSFWERSHGALGRFRHRALPSVGRAGWSRGGRGGPGRAPPGRYGPAENHGSPSRKPKQPARTRPRKLVHSVSKPESGVDESFEDLLSKYKQIQLELECIRKEETMALGPVTAEVLPPPPAQAAASAADVEDLEKAEKKVFQAFNIKPLRQKLPRPAELDELQKKWAEPEEGDGAEVECERAIPAEREEEPCSRCGEPTTGAAAEARLKPAKDSVSQESGSGPEGAPPCGSRVTTRSASTAAVAAAEGSRTRSRSADLDPKKKAADGAKPALKTGTAKPLASKKVASQGDQPSEAAAESGGADPEKKCEVPAKEADRPACVCCGASPTSSEDSAASADKPGPKVEEEELSELQLRLLALQSASKKWQQKEQQVMKKSKDRITKVAPEWSVGAPPAGRSRVTTRSAAAAERNRTRSKPGDSDRIKSAPKAPGRDRDRPKAGLKGPPERGRPPEKPHVAKKTAGLGSVGKQAFRKQQLRTWKLQQQGEQDERRRQEEEERRKREEEIRRIRDLSNQDEQYNRFMKLVGGRKRPRSKSRDEDHRKSSGKGGLDSSGNLYQYDNYDEVAMDTDSETGSPVRSPARGLLTAEDAARHAAPDAAAFGADFPQSFLSEVLPGGPPPPPPLPPPPDELDPPPKPPFADEEEEEEMLLRETCLMSMAHKRVAVPERSAGDPPSPGCAPPAGVQQPVRGNLSIVSLNMVPQSQRKFSRGPHAARAPLVLPRHKAVVVSLKDSEDSDSDADAGSSAPSVFGGLEFMIKEARRTVEAAKPKAGAGCEKENEPLGTAEVLPEARKLDDSGEQSSREKPRTPRGDLSSAAGPQSAPDHRQRPAVDLYPAAPQQRLGKLRELLQRDEAMLKHLLQQELKKTESLKASEAKVSKLREQLQASEKIANGNRTLLRKLQEQVRRVEQRVSVKRSVLQRVEQEVLRAQQHASGGAPRRADAAQPAKKQRQQQRVDTPPRGSEHHFAELIAHKQRLQQLESEYALKIQKLKAAQALRNRAAAVAAPAAETAPAETAPPFSDCPAPPLQRAPPPSPLAPPQPSLHDLTQDKLTLESEDAPEPDDAETVLAMAAGGAQRSSRRRSSGSFTRPHLDASSSTPAKPAQTALNVQVPAEMWAGLSAEVLKQTFRPKVPIGELMLAELRKLGEQVDARPVGQVPPLEAEPAAGQSGSSELRPVPFGAYRSPLLIFRSYRFSPYYRTKEKLSLSSVTFSHAVDAARSFCRFDLTGTCNHDGCTWQHMRNVTLTGNQLFEDILSYNLSLIGCSESSSDDDISAATESYMKKVFGTNKDRMGVDQKAVLLVSKVNESQHHVPPFTTCKDPRRWRPRPQGAGGPADDSGDEAVDAHLAAARRADDAGACGLTALDACVSSEDRRYFLSETDDVGNLESSVAESPGDTQLWIKLAFKYLSQSDSPAEDNLEAALNTLSRALESNCEDPEVWSHYLTLFSRRGSSEEVQEMCEMAVEHAANHRVWWQYLTLEGSFERKDSVCERLLHFLLAEASAGVSDKLSFQLMEALLYRVQLSVLSGRPERGVLLLQGGLKEQDVAAHLLPADRALLWLAYIHLTEFERLPDAFYDPAESGPSRLLRPRSFLLPWTAPQDVRAPLGSLVALFQDGVRHCSEESASDRERTLACMPLHTNLIHLYRLLHRWDDAVALCEAVLRACPDSCAVRGALAELHVRSGDEERALSVWLLALSECPHNAEVFYRCCCFLMEREKSDAVAPLFKGFVLSLCGEEQDLGDPTRVLRNLLGFSSDACGGSPLKRSLEETLRGQSGFLHLVHCRWQWLRGSADQAVDAFERALGSNLQLEELHRLWLDYLLFSCSPKAGCSAAAAAHSRKFSDLVHRCLSTVPTRLEVPFNSAMFWSCYRFHNQVVSLYLDRVPQSQHALLLERLHSAMPNNTVLGLRLLLLLWQDGLKEQLRFQARMLSNSSPRCLSVWKILLAVQVELKQQVEVRVVHQQALQHLPLSADLWKHRLQFEAAMGGASERLRHLMDLCRQAGVSLSGGVGGF